MLIQSYLSIALVMCLKCTVHVQKTGTGKKTQRFYKTFLDTEFWKKPERKVRIDVTCKTDVVKHHAEDQ